MTLSPVQFSGISKHIPFKMDVQNPLYPKQTPSEQLTYDRLMALATKTANTHNVNIKVDIFQKHGTVAFEPGVQHELGREIDPYFADVTIEGANERATDAADEDFLADLYEDYAEKPTSFNPLKNTENFAFKMLQWVKV